LSRAHTRILYVTDATAAASFGEEMRSAAVADARLVDDNEALLGHLHAALNDSLMGTRLYVAGPESFMGLVMRTALQFNLNKDEIRAEECGTLARRVYCIHCRAVTENVKTNIARCSGCRRSIVVRDHYSRRLAAYMGVMVDAEAPGELAPIKEVFL
jgi:ferredoxin-NADP reductase